MQITTRLTLGYTEKVTRMLVLVSTEHTCRWCLSPRKLINLPGTKRPMAFFIPALLLHKSRRESLRYQFASIWTKFFSSFSNTCIKGC
ncbi:hypothetical protein I79_007562 [Cricetulus griseus]|uniref:Uncharacterized protein n=1 Tax=Cricetulus griseus TaxID=10029 RepID=G3HAV3_CRIGR|nr:hypothetical protein I79_007562 [Cricetulus griseus]